MVSVLMKKNTPALLLLFSIPKIAAKMLMIK
jgi:hypothetical protein